MKEAGSSFAWWLVASGLMHAALLALRVPTAAPQVAVTPGPISIELVTQMAEPTGPPKALESAEPDLPAPDLEALPEEQEVSEVPSMKEQGAVVEAQPDGLRNVAPVYPAIARRNGWEGVVVLRVLVSERGVARTVQIRRSSGYLVLDRAATSAVSRWRFNPARIGTRPIESWVSVPVRFSLRDR